MSGGQSQGQIEERNKVERVVMEHGVHLALEAGADVIGVNTGDAYRYSLPICARCP